MGNQVKPVRHLLASIGHGWLHCIGHALSPNAPCRTLGDARIWNPKIMLKVALEWGIWVHGTYHLAVGSLGTCWRLVQTPEGTWMRYQGLIKRALLKDQLPQLHNWGKCKIVHLFILWFLPGFLTFVPFILQCMGCLAWFQFKCPSGCWTLSACFLSRGWSPPLGPPVGLPQLWWVHLMGSKGLIIIILNEHC